MKSLTSQGRGKVSWTQDERDGSYDLVRRKPRWKVMRTCTASCNQLSDRHSEDHIWLINSSRLWRRFQWCCLKRAVWKNICNEPPGRWTETEMYIIYIFSRSFTQKDKALKMIEIELGSHNEHRGINQQVLGCFLLSRYFYLSFLNYVLFHLWF